MESVGLGKGYLFRRSSLELEDDGEATEKVSLESVIEFTHNITVELGHLNDSLIVYLIYLINKILI
jgi:hypothetical protein